MRPLSLAGLGGAQAAAAARGRHRPATLRQRNYNPQKAARGETAGWKGLARKAWRETESSAQPRRLRRGLARDQRDGEGAWPGMKGAWLQGDRQH